MAKEIKLPKPEFIAGDIDYPEMIKKDFRKALMILVLAILSTAVIITGFYFLLLYPIL